MCGPQCDYIIGDGCELLILLLRTLSAGRTLLTAPCHVEVMSALGKGLGGSRSSSHHAGSWELGQFPSG